MTRPIIGLTYGLTPERMTLTEALRREQGRAVWAQALRCLRFLGLAQ